MNARIRGGEQVIDEENEEYRGDDSDQLLPLDVTTPRDSYAWNYGELVTLLTLSESLAEA